ncbi:MAG: ABC transporter substrate-binding protein [Egibacteraceae bacterium]
MLPPTPALLLSATRAAAILVAILVTAVACSSPASDGDGASPAASLPRADTQDLTVAVGADPFLRPRRSPATGDEPAGERRAIPDVGVRTDGPNPGIFETLTRVTPTFGVGPGLAEGWEQVSPTRWRFRLRSGVTFHDGSAFEAGAVVETLESVARRQHPPRGMEPGGVTAADDHTVEIALTSPNLRLPEQLADPSTAIRAAGTIAGAGDDPATTPTGTGPFRFGSYTAGSELAVEAYAGYWGGAPQLDSLTFRFGPAQDASRVLATRQAQVVGHVPHHTLAQVSGRDRVAASPPARSAYLLLNVGGSDDWATLQDHRVRRAISLAIDRVALTGAAWPDHGEPNHTLIPPAVLGTAAAAAVSAPDHDPAAARALLDEAGWATGGDGLRRRDGRPLEVTLVLSRPEELAQAAEAVRAQLAAVGIAVAIPDQGDAPVDRYQRVNDGTFDLFLDLRGQTDANPCALCRFFSIRPGGQLTISGTVGAGDAADALFEEAFTVRSIDSARRDAAALMEVVVTDEVVAIPLGSLPNVWLLSPRVQGFEPSAVLGTQRWEHVWLTV